MDRQRLIQEVKGAYESLANRESQNHFHQTTTGLSPEAYYENILNMVLHEIEKGTFDGFSSAAAVVEAVAKDKEKWLSQWQGGAF